MFAAALLVASSTVSATGAQDGSPAGGSTAKPAKEKKVCKQSEASSTSRMRKRVCRSASEWDAAQQEKSDFSDLNRVSKN